MILIWCSFSAFYTPIGYWSSILAIQGIKCYWIISSGRIFVTLRAIVKKLATRMKFPLYMRQIKLSLRNLDFNRRENI